jgi:hypothetical protein
MCFRQLCITAALLTWAHTAVPTVAEAQRLEDPSALVGHRARVTTTTGIARVRYEGVVARIDSTAVTLRCRDCPDSLRAFRWSEVQAMEIRRARAASPGELLGNVGLGLLGGGLFGGALGASACSSSRARWTRRMTTA